MIKRTEREIVLLSMSAVSTVVILPFIFIRFAAGEISMAIADLIIAIFMFVFFLYVYKTHKVRRVSLMMSLFLIGVIIFLIVTRGPATIYWYYPVILAIFYLNAQRTAIIMCCISALMITLSLLPLITSAEILTIFVSMLLTIIFSFVIFRSYSEVQGELKLLATTDPLTSAGNRRALDSHLANLVLSQDRKKYPMCLILLDVDHFKKINDNYGHLMGDDILVAISSLIVSNIRVLDSFYRYGGEEFIVAPLSVDLKMAGVVAENLRIMIEEHRFPSNITVTISLGIAQFHHGEKVEEWIARADSALYIAKSSGRNKACLAE